MSNNKYLISLHGGGDSYYIIVGKAAFDWIQSARPKFPRGKFSVKERVPDDVIKQSNGNMAQYVDVTTGSCENDRALALIEGYACYDDHPMQINVKDVWEGCIY